MNHEAAQNDSPSQGNAVKIYFCDICNQSIPFKDLDDGIAVAVRGKLICASCNATVVAAQKSPGAPVMPGLPNGAPAGGAAPVVSSGGSRGGVSLIWMVLAMGGAVGASWYLQKEEMKKLETRIGNDVAAGFEDTRKVGQRVDAVGRSLEKLQAGLDELGRQIRTEEEVSAARTRKSIAEFDTRFEQVKSYVSENERAKEQLQQLEMRSTASNEVLLNLQKELSQMRIAMTDLAGVVAKGGIAAANNPQPAANGNNNNPGGGANGNNNNSAEAPPSDPGVAPNALPLQALPNDLQPFAKKLKAADPADRWDAVDQLGRSRDGRVVAYITPMLKDSDDFVRQLSANVIGDLAKYSKAATPFLIDALADEKPFVREAAAQSLRKVTDQNIKFDTFGKKEDRAKQQDAWRKWWTANGEK